MSSQNPHQAPPPGNGQTGGYGQAPGQAPAYGNYHGNGNQQGYGHPQQGYGHPGAGPYGYQNAPVHAGSQPGVHVGFADAIKRFYAKYAQFSGRASRSEYWWVALYLGAVYFVLSLLMSAGTTPFGELNGFGMLMTALLVIFALGHIVPSIAIGIRRLHDANFSGWFYLLSLIPYVGGLVLVVFMVMPSKPEGARFDR